LRRHLVADAERCESVAVQVSEAAVRAVRTSLTELYLQRNRLRALPRALLLRDHDDDDDDDDDHSSASAVLRVLDLSSNPLGADVDRLAGRSSAGHLPATLEVLRLRDVGLVRWPGALLRRLASLAALDLSGNRLAAIPDGALAPLVRLRRLDASRNRLVGVDPGRLTGHLPPPPVVDLAGNPLHCGCSVAAPLCRYLDQSESETAAAAAWGRNQTGPAPRRTLPPPPPPRCRTPAEWHGSPLTEFCVSAAAARCAESPLLPPAGVLAACLGLVGVVVAALAAAVLLSRRYRRRRRSGAPAAAGKAAAGAGCRPDSYRFVDETSLTASSSNSSSAATTTSGVAAAAPPGPALHHPAPPSRPPTTGFHAQDSYLLASARHWL